MAVHDHAVFGVDLEPGHMAHHVGGKLGGELASVAVAPEQLRRLAAVGEADKAKIHDGGILDVLEIFSGAGDKEVFPFQLRGGKAGGDGTQDLVGVQVFLHFRLVQQQADVAAVALIPAVVIHVRGGADHLHHKGRGQNVSHFNLLFVL